MQANKNPEFEIKECDLNFYHVRVNRKLHNPVNKTYQDDWQTVIFKSKREFDIFNENKHVLGLDGEELIHDPSFHEPEAKNKGGRPKKEE